MNIKERKKALEAIMDARRFLHPDPSKHFEKKKEKPKKFEKTKFEEELSRLRITNTDWASMVKPPLSSFAPPWVFNQLLQLSQDVKLMSRPAERYKIMEKEILNPFGFKILASGTNRRTFYYDYDPSIVLKVGSDKVGVTDNLSEYNLQNLIKPFCSKTYEVHPTGIVALSERVEVMTKETYARFANQIFDILMHFFYKGFIFEDVGSNFFKNWAVRFDFGPVIIDYPYIYEVDWTKLKCNWVNPATHKVCGGELDYAYERGMNEIVCTKCGNRYSAKHLARLTPSTAFAVISRKGKFLMKPKFRIAVVAGNGKDSQVVYRSYEEKAAQPKKVQTPIVRPNPKVSVSANKDAATPAQRVAMPRPKAVAYGNGGNRRHQQDLRPEVKQDIQIFLEDMERRYSKGCAIDIARRLGMFYETLEDKAKREAKEKEEAEKKAEEDAKPQPQQQESVDPDEVTVEGVKAQVDMSKFEGDNDEQKSGVVSAADPNRQKTNLYPAKPMTAEQIEAEEQKNQNENAVMGFPSEPLVNTMRMKERIPSMVKKLHASLDQFDSLGEDKDNVNYLIGQALNIIKHDLIVVTNCDVNDIKIEVEPTADSRNNKCYALSVFVRQSPLFDATIYPNRGDQIQHTEMHIEDGINLVDNATTTEEAKATVEDEAEKYNEEIKTYMDAMNGDNPKLPDPPVSEEEKEKKALEDFFWDKVESIVDIPESYDDDDRKDLYTAKLQLELMNYKRPIPYARSNSLAKKFVQENYPFVANVSDEL